VQIRGLTRILLLAGLVGLAGLPGAVRAQYFGQNKVQYRSLDFSVLETEHFDLYYYPSERELAVRVGRMAERWYARFSRLLGHDIRQRQPLILYASHPDFEQTNATGGRIDESTGGFTEPLKRRVVLPAAASLRETDHVLGHELVHAFQFDMTGAGYPGSGVVPGALRLSGWFIEGMAEYLSVGPDDPFTTMWVRGADLAGRLPDLGDLRDPHYFPYRYGQALWAWIGGTYGDDRIGDLLSLAGHTGSVRGAIAAGTGLDADSVVERWHAAVRAQDAAVLASTLPADSQARPVIAPGMGRGNVAIGPALSPDGSELVFASEKSLFSLELFLADARTGRVVRKLTETALDPHFQSLQYLNSSGAWSPDGSRFALATVRKGRADLAILDPHTGKRLREIRLPAFGEIFNPTWAPDGRRVAFTAHVSGFTDLYVLDLRTGRTRRLTHDEFAELHPAWSPDGSRIAFITERFTSDLPDLSFGAYRLALIDPQSGRITELPHLGEADDETSPGWAPDGRSLYFVSNRGGISNVYRLDLAAGSFERLTDVQTGVAGITPLSPALSVARRSGDVVFSVNGRGDFVFELYALERGPDGEFAGREPADTAVARGAPLPDTVARRRAGRLPPLDRRYGEVPALLAEQSLGLPDTVTFRTHGYGAGLTLDYVAQPTFGVGADQFGVYAGGGGALYFSDMLGNRNLSVLAQVEGTAGRILEGTALYGSYVNLGSRIDWAVQGGQIPYLSRQIGLGTTVVDGREAQVYRDVWFWQINRELSGLLAYPLNRAERVELSGGVQNVDFASEVRETAYDPVSGRILSERTTSTAYDTLSSLNLARASAALVYDNAIFGGTGPLVGERARLEVGSSVGSIGFYTLLGDFRKYVMPVRPLTLAARVLTYGRYGAGAEDHRLRELFLGYSYLVRGYDAGSFSLAECPADGSGSCPVFDRLLGSRLGVLNVELRLPLIGLGDLSLVHGGPVPPIDLVGFFDAGVAWTRATTPAFLGGGGAEARRPVRSFGAGLRFNMFGLTVLELDWVRPLDRPGRGWVWALGIGPGF